MSKALLVLLLAVAFAIFAGAMVAVARLGVVLTAPAVSAELFGRETDGMDQVVDALERERRQVQVLADVFDHSLVGFAIRVGVLRDIGVLAFLFANVAARDEVVDALGTREVDELSRIN